MKKVLFFVGLFIGLQGYAQTGPYSTQPGITSYAKEFRLNVNTNYVFQDRVDSYYSSTAYYDGEIKGGFQWGLGLEYMLRPSQGIELTYLRQDTKAPTTYYDDGAVVDPIKYREFDLGINYIFIGGNRYFIPGGKLDPYLGLQAGIAIINASNTSNGKDNSSTKFAWGVKLGTNYWASEKIGIKLQAGLQSATQAVGGGLYFGTGGIGAGLTSLSSLYQFSLGGGVALRFGR